MAMWAVHKFGGTSLADADCYRLSASIVSRETGERTLIIVSAQGKQTDVDGNPVHDKVTSLLIECSVLASQQNPAYETLLVQIIDRHIHTAQELLEDGVDLNHIIEQLKHDCNDLKYVLKSAWLSKRHSVDKSACPWWTGYGEMWSARLMAAFLKQASRYQGKSNSVACVDARRIIVVSERSGGTVLPHLESTKEKWNAWLKDGHEATEVVVMTGFICSTEQGMPTTLGRDGSDYSASIMAAVIAAEKLTIWSDVDGVYSADPTVVRNAIVRSELSYQEAMELAYFGAKILHPKTMTPLIGQNIPICIRNTFRPELPGSLILPSKRTNSPLIQGFSSILKLSLITVEGSGLIGVPGIAWRLFGSLHASGCSVVLITQAGSEHSICVAVPIHQACAAVVSIAKEFRDELISKEIQTIDNVGPCACLAAVGDGMRHSTGVAGSVLSALGRANISVRAMSQGASERNISVVVDESDAELALNAVHNEFIEPKPSVACVVFHDNWKIEKSMIEYLNNHRNEGEGCSMIVKSVFSKDESGLPDRLLAELKATNAKSLLLIDCSKGPSSVASYSPFTENGVSVLTCNSKSVASQFEIDSIKGVPSSYIVPRLFLFSRVLASIPIVDTIQWVQDAGDKIITILLAFPCEDEEADRSTERTDTQSELVMLAASFGVELCWKSPSTEESCEAAHPSSNGVGNKSRGTIFRLDLIGNQAISSSVKTTAICSQPNRLNAAIITRNTGESHPITLSGNMLPATRVYSGMQFKLSRLLRSA